MKVSVLLLSCCLFVAYSVFTTLDLNATAQNTYEEVPADKTCDELIGGTTGLFSLCVAFHAQDCEPDFSAEEPFAKCNSSALKLWERYNNRKQPGDPPMPE